MGKQPDLLISAGKTEGKLGPGLRFKTGSITLENQGALSSPLVRVQFYLSSNRKFTPEHDRYLGRTVFGRLKPGEIASERVVGKLIPSDLAKGRYFIGAVIDPQNQVAEVNEDNNTFQLGSFSVAADLPDLRVESLRSVGSYDHYTGETLTLRHAISNAGVAATGVSSIARYVLSESEDFSRGNIVLGSKRVASLDPGQQLNVTRQLVLPSASVLSPGKTYHLGVVLDAVRQIQENNKTNNVRLVNSFTILDKRPDLVVASGTVDGPLAQGGDLQMKARIKNKGPGVVTRMSHAGLYLSSDKTINRSDDLLASATVGRVGWKLDPGKAKAVDFLATLPENLTPGKRYHLAVLADPENTLPEENELNNARILASFVAPQKPDLRISGGRVKGVPGPGNEITLIAQIKNAGKGEAVRGAQINYYLSTDSFITAKDRLLGSLPLGSMISGQIIAKKLTARLPTNLKPATRYHLGAVVDPGSVIVETNETNNKRVIDDFLLTGRPDLVVTAGTVVGDIFAGGSVKVSTTIRNQGLGATGQPSAIDYYLSQDKTFDPGDQLVASDTLPRLASAKSTSLETMLSLPGDLVDGRTYHLVAVADPANLVKESREGNNIHLVQTFTARQLPDLEISRGRVEGTMNEGEQVTLVGKVKNAGLGTLPKGARIKFYLSEDGFISTKDTLLGGKTLGEIAPGKGVTKNLTVKLPPGLKANTRYRIGAIVDPGKQVAESNEANNRKVLDSFLAVPRYQGSDLLPALTQGSSLQWVPDGPPTGSFTQSVRGQVAVSATVTNIGTMSSGAYHATLYLSDDQNITADDTERGEIFNLPVLAPGESKQIDWQEYPLFSEQMRQSGTAYVGMIVKTASLAENENSANNAVLLGSLDIGAKPDVTIDGSLVGSEPLELNQYREYEINVRNVGEGTMFGWLSVGFYITQDPSLPFPATPEEGLVLSRDTWFAATYPKNEFMRPVSFSISSSKVNGSGRHYVYAVVDRTQAFDETDETNNTVLLGTIDVPAASMAKSPLLTSADVSTESLASATTGGFAFTTTGADLYAGADALSAFSAAPPLSNLGNRQASGSFVSEHHVVA